MTQKNNRAVTLIPGDGIGPEVTYATRRLIDATGVKIQWEEFHAGASVFKKGIPSGVPQETIDSIQRTRCALKGPLETPVGFGEKSANVTLRKLFETYGNLRPVRELAGVPTPYSGRGVDLIVVRENVEDLYAGIEHMQTADVAQCLKLISRKGCEKIVRLAFETARAEGRRSVHCATKANIMKLTEGMLKQVFEKIAPEYPDIQAQHIIVDNCAHQLVKKPEQFEVIVTTNMNGDILSDLTSALVGGLGFAPSANIGNECAIFEAVHGSAPKYAGKNVINPTAMILSGVMMLRYLGEFEAASLLENAVYYTWEQAKTRTRDVVGDAEACSTTELEAEIQKNFGKRPSKAPAREYRPIQLPRKLTLESPATTARNTIGVDLFVEYKGSSDSLGKLLEDLTKATSFKLKMVSNRGTKVYPATGANPDTVDHWRCRFLWNQPAPDVPSAALGQLFSAVEGKLRWMHVEKLIDIDGKAGYTRAQGED
jgi:isocitrate dehydrogenase